MEDVELVPFACEVLVPSVSVSDSKYQLKYFKVFDGNGFLLKLRKMQETSFFWAIVCLVLCKKQLFHLMH